MVALTDTDITLIEVTAGTRSARLTPKGPTRCKDTRVDSGKPEPISFACAAETKNP